MTTGAHRGTVFLVDAEILKQDAHPAEQYVLRLSAPECARHARPGTFVHVGCDPLLPMRRPFSIMRASPKAGWIELLYKALGQGTRLLAARRAGERVSLLGPIGNPFRPLPGRPRPLLMGGGVGIPPMVFLADMLRRGQDLRPLALLGSEVPFPFKPRPSGYLVPGVPPSVIAAVPLLDDWGIPSRLASLKGFAGCFEGYVTELARLWLESLADRDRRDVEVFACGPHPMLEAVARLARDFDLPCQVSLEEFMACGVGGCAGCTVPVQTPEGTAMKRVCVDGPVLDGRQVFR
jgi:dihydroorotate dehydrogenase electron transfer subunit